MQEAIRSKILEILAKHRIMTVATLRPDGWPQATTVGYVSDGLDIFFLCSPQSQKAANLARDPRVSITIDHDVPNPMAIEGLSMAARAIPVGGPTDKARMLEMLAEKYPEYRDMPPVDLKDIAVFRIEPEVISVLDYTKGFGHSDLVFTRELAPLA